MIYVNSAARQGPTRHTAPLYTPRQIDDACQSAAQCSARPGIPRRPYPFFPRSSLPPLPIILTPLVKDTLTSSRCPTIPTGCGHDWQVMARGSRPTQTFQVLIAPRGSALAGAGLVPGRSRRPG